MKTLLKAALFAAIAANGVTASAAESHVPSFEAEQPAVACGWFCGGRRGPPKMMVEDASTTDQIEVQEAEVDPRKTENLQMACGWFCGGRRGPPSAAA